MTAPRRSFRSPRTVRCALLLGGLLAAFGATPAAAQFGGGQGFRDGAVARAFVVGGRAGYDFRGDAPILGAFARSSLFWRLSVQAVGELTFLDGLTERQIGADLLFSAGPGLQLGGGPVVRNSVYDVGPEASTERENRTGYSLVAILGGAPGRGRLVTGLEIRFTSVDDLDAQLLALQVGLPLLRW